MKRTLLLIGCCCAFNILLAQFKNDNVVFRTIFLEDLCQELKKQPQALLLDVRSPGEYNDTSMYENLRIGRLKGAKNINISDLAQRMNDLPSDKNQAIFVYCSHSQRSRRVSKTLIDSGYKNVYNINGGMTELNMLRNNGFPCLNEIYETSNPFITLSPETASALISANKDIYILDVRKDSAYQGISSIEKLNAMGKLKGSNHIPLDAIQASLASIPKDKKILIVDSYGDESVQAATQLAQKDYKYVYIVFNGLDNWMSEPKSEFPNKGLWWESNSKYSLVGPQELSGYFDKKDNALILDVRTREEFTNTVKQPDYLNRGHIINAKNVPLAELQSRLSEIAAYKNKDIVVYAFGSSPESYSAAKLLASNGFSKVSVLTTGLFGVRWRAANIKGNADMMNWVVDVPEVNR
jgi:rhodanese-related sulfurtransferase